MTALVVCVGNPLRGDDAVAWHVADLLSAGPARVITGHQLVPELAHDAAGASRLIVVDACDDGSPPGTVTVTEAVKTAVKGAVTEAVTEAARAPAVSHAFGPADLLALAAELYGAHPAATLVTVSVASTDVAIGLSPDVEAAVPIAAAAVRAALRDASRVTEDVRL